MLDKKDAQWWLLEVQKRPDSAPDLIRMLADRLAFLDKQNEELRAENIALRREARSSASADLEVLQQRIRELESAQGSTANSKRMIVYGADRIFLNAATSEAANLRLERLPTTSPDILLVSPNAHCLIVTAESRAFGVPFADIPAPQPNTTALLGNPRDVAAILDRSLLERLRFLTLWTHNGYVYSVLVGTLGAAPKGDKLIRNLLPDDAIVGAMASANADLLLITQRGRWIRFSERAIAGSGGRPLELVEGDQIASVIPLTDEPEVLCLTEDGRLFAKPSGDFGVKRQLGGAGSVWLRGKGILGVTTQREWAVLTARGRLLHLEVSGLINAARSEQGARLPSLPEGEQVLAFAAI